MLGKFIFHFFVALTVMVCGLLIGELMIALGPLSLVIILPLVYAAIVTYVEIKDDAV